MTEKIKHHLKSRDLKPDSMGTPDAPKFRVFDGKKYRAVMHGMPHAMALKQVKEARLRGFNARIVIHKYHGIPSLGPHMAYTLYVCPTQSLKEKRKRQAEAHYRWERSRNSGGRE